MGQLITKLKNLKPVSINNNRFPAWGYVLIVFSLSMKIGVGLFFIVKRVAASTIRPVAVVDRINQGLHLTNARTNR